MGRTLRARRGAALWLWAVMVVLTAGCSGPPATNTPQELVAFAAFGSPGQAYGRYVLVGDLAGNNLKTFNGLPFSASFEVPSAVPAMEVSLVGAAPGSTVSCRISVNGRVVAAATAPAPGPDVQCQAPAGSTG